MGLLVSYIKTIGWMMRRKLAEPAWGGMLVLQWRVEIASKDTPAPKPELRRAKEKARLIKVGG